MKEDEFIDLANNRLNKCMDTMRSKGEEYTRNNDKLHNFKRAAEMLGCTPEEALMGMATKHIVSVYDMVRDVAGGAVVSERLVEEKIGDVINYMLLLEAILTEEHSEVWGVIDLEGAIHD